MVGLAAAAANAGRAVAVGLDLIAEVAVGAVLVVAAAVAVQGNQHVPTGRAGQDE